MSANGSVPENANLSEAKSLLLARRLKGLSALQQEAEQIPPRDAKSKTTISVDQYRIWLHNSMQPDIPAYNEPVVIQFRGPLDIAILRDSLNYFVVRHESWRTSFRVEQETVFQRVLRKLQIDIEMVDISGLPEADRELAVENFATEQARRPFDLSRAPMFRAVLVRLAPDDHRLCMVLHHIIFDGLSLHETFVPELDAIYKALSAGVEPTLPPLRLQYCDYSEWREKQIASPTVERHVEFWKRELAGELPLLRLPMDRPRPAVISQRGAIETFSISKEFSDELLKVSHAQGVTLYMVMLASFKTLLFRYSGQEDVIVGGAADGRRRSELKGMMGYMLDTFPVRSHPSAKLPFSEYLKQVKQVALNAIDAAEAPFDRIVQALDIKRDLSHHPIFQVFFSFLAPAGELPEGWEIKPKSIDTGASKFDIYLEIEERPSHTAACVIYNTDLFDPGSIQRMFGHWMTLLKGICENPDCALGDLPLLTGEERKLILETWNETAVPMPATTVHGLFAEQVKRTPNKIAVEFEGTSWTYAQLNREAERFAEHLRRAGADRNRLVAICVDRSAYMLAGLLGILKTGAAYLPLDPGTPQARVTMCLEDAAPTVVLTQRSLAEVLPVGNAQVLILEDIIQVEASAEATPAAVAGSVGPDDTAYVIHTSGSTGRPKAVVLQHRAVVNLLLSMQREPGFTENDCLVAVTTVSFDIAVLELFLPIITGGRVVIASRNVAIDPYQLATLLEKSNCTVMQATPATWRALLASEWGGRPGLRVLCGGEALTRDLAEQLLAADLELWNVYGPTETTIWSTVQRVQSGKGAVPIGRPIANTTTYILDENEQPVPVGVAGELYIGGIGLAEGYRGQPELTAQKFVTPAVSQGSRIYRTGDYAVYRQDGTIECQGRADNQVKVRGHRIELEEIELNLNSHSGVASAAARTWPDPAGGHRISAYLVGKSETVPTGPELREYLRDRLPDYMIPSNFTVLASMPLTPNGKMDRKALPPPDDYVAPRAADDVPMNDVEIKLARIWAEALKVESVGRYDNFFDLGGHSLLLVLLFARINKDFGSSLPITSIFDAQTLSALATVLKEKTSISSLVPVQTSGTKPPLFMAHSYLLYRGLSSALGPDQPFYGLRELETDGNLSIVERAVRYVGDMRRVQPHGPYRIAGWCAAGPLAVEIAKQLILAGQQVALLELFDSWLPGYEEVVGEAQRAKTYVSAAKDKFSRFRQKVADRSLMEQFKHLGRVLTRIAKERRDAFYIEHWSKMNALSKKLDIPLPQFMHNTTLQTFAAMKEFQAEKLPVCITLIRAKDSRQLAGGTPGCGWEQVAELGVEVFWAPGDHETMFRGENLLVTAKIVTDSLNASRRNSVTRDAFTPERVSSTVVS